MKLPLILILLSLMLFVAGASGRALGQVNAQEAVGFENRFVSLEAQIDENGKQPDFKYPKDAADVCLPNQALIKAYGFHTLTTQEQPVSFGVYSRMQYYALAPKWDGNILTPGYWSGADVTEAAHRHGSKADVVISNRRWFFEDGKAGDSGYDYNDGLWLTKSFVLLTLIDDIANLVRTHEFDGVTFDFRLPNDVDTIESYTFLVNSLEKRLKEDDKGSRANSLLKPEAKQINLVIDRAFIDGLAANYTIRQERVKILAGLLESDMDMIEDLSDPELVKILKDQTGGELTNMLGGQPRAELKKKLEVLVQGDFQKTIDDNTQSALSEILRDLSGAVDLLIVERPKPTDRLLEQAVEQIILENGGKLEMAVLLPNGKPILGNDPVVGIWDVAGEGVGWNAPLEIKVLGRFPEWQKTARGLVCTNREWIIDPLSWLTPALTLLLAVSWVFYGFPMVVKKSVSNFILWGLLAIVLVVFVLLLYGLPSLDLKDTRVYVVAGSFVPPLIYAIWTGLSKIGRHDYP